MITFRELSERIERESLHPTTLDLPFSIVQRRKKGGFEEERTMYVSDIRVDSAHGIELIVAVDPWSPA